MKDLGLQIEVLRDYFAAQDWYKESSAAILADRCRCRAWGCGCGYERLLGGAEPVLAREAAAPLFIADQDLPVPLGGGNPLVDWVSPLRHRACRRLALLHPVTH